MIQHFQIADLVFSLEYESKDSPFAIIADKISMMRIPDGVPQIRFQYLDRLVKPNDPYTKLERSVIGNNFYQSRTKLGDQFQISVDESNTWTVGIVSSRYSLGKRIRYFLKKYWKYNYLYGSSLNEMHAKKFIYGILEPIFLIWFSEHGKTLIHSSTVEKDGKAFLFPAWGGVGKTSLMSYFLAAGWNYLGDDIAILSEDGKLYHFPLPMHIYGYHKFVCKDMYDRLTAQMQPADRKVWDLSQKFCAPDKISRWVSPECVYGKERIALSCDLQTVIHMQRSTINEPISLQETSPQTVARYTTNTIMNEIPNMMSLTSYPNSHSVKPCFSETIHVLENLKQNAVKGFSRANVYEMILGSKTTPEETWNYLKTKFPEL